MTQNPRPTMRSIFLLAISCLASAPLLLSPQALDAQSRGKAASAEATLSTSIQAEIRDFYAAHPTGDAYPLPPGIHRRLARGKALPPGIAKKSPPPQLRGALSLQEGYEIIEVGLDVLLVEVATSIVHDVLSNVVR